MREILASGGAFGALMRQIRVMEERGNLSVKAVATIPDLIVFVLYDDLLPLFIDIVTGSCPPKAIIWDPLFWNGFGSNIQCWALLLDGISYKQHLHSREFSFMLWLFSAHENHRIDLHDHGFHVEHFCTSIAKRKSGFDGFRDCLSKCIHCCISSCVLDKMHEPLQEKRGRLVEGSQQGRIVGYNNLWI